LKELKDQQLSKAGFQKQEDGYSFPGINATQVNEAFMERKAIKPEEIIEPKVSFKIMNS